jgi:hypothetical protein
MSYTFFLPNPDRTRPTLSTVTHKTHPFTIVKYNKDHGPVTTNDGMYRSVIYDSNTGDCVCFSPPKSVDYEVFAGGSANIHSTLDDNIIAQELVEGTMINVFFNQYTNSWMTSTKSTLEGKTCFFRTNYLPLEDCECRKTFHDMFMEACKSCNLNLLEDLDPKRCYSFVLQHPENRIVVPFTEPNIYLIGEYSMTKELDGCNITSHDIYKSNLIQVKVPQLYNSDKLDTTFQMLKDTYASDECITPYTINGFVLYLHGINTKPLHFTPNLQTYAAGFRAKKRNPMYEHVRHLRGNQPKLQYHFLVLRKATYFTGRPLNVEFGPLDEFLHYFPEFSEAFCAYEFKVREYVAAVYRMYVKCFINREISLKNVDKQYRNTLYHLHKHYLENLRPNKMKVNLEKTTIYVGRMKEAHLMHYLNLKFHPTSIIQKKNKPSTTHH